ncbi:alpha/beta hydrolase [Vibrio hannami]|uniref:alpha/beta hydrolase n=1 Tax=Vibrio hannami TaxID=2717094 RepID=UPI00240FDBA7|nr:alpha/beta hydrolase [Vibrio hannami]MDG3085500.1 alpha/beta hydrolase [Vibrio hannami]
MKNKLIATLMLGCTVYAVTAQASYYTEGTVDVVRYDVITDVTYGQGAVMAENENTMMDLTMDVYSPVEMTDEPLPAIILTHGGSFHRGNPRIPYVGIGGQTTTMSQYAMRYAEEGYVVFTIKYRVAPDNPVIDMNEHYSNDLLLDFFQTPEAIHQGNVIRSQMGLELFTEDNVVEIMRNAVVAAAEDLRTALHHVKAENATYNIDPDLIALGGFSAGAVTSINVAYGMQEDVAAVIANSGYPSVFNMDKLIDEESELPPGLFFLAQNDYPVVDMELKPFIKKLSSLNADYSFNWIPSHGHFYPSGVTSLGSDGSQMSVEQRSIEFLNEVLKRK